MSVPGARGEGPRGGDASRETIEVRLNGDLREIPAGLTVTGLLGLLELRPEVVVVELNREILTRGRYGDELVQDGDTLELVHFVGGGRQ